MRFLAATVLTLLVTLAVAPTYGQQQAGNFQHDLEAELIGVDYRPSTFFKLRSEAQAGTWVMYEIRVFVEAPTGNSPQDLAAQALAADILGPAGFGALAKPAPVNQFPWAHVVSNAAVLGVDEADVEALYDAAIDQNDPSAVEDVAQPIYGAPGATDVVMDWDGRWDNWPTPMVKKWNARLAFPMSATDPDVDFLFDAEKMGLDSLQANLAPGSGPGSFKSFFADYYRPALKNQILSLAIQAVSVLDYGAFSGVTITPPYCPGLLGLDFDAVELPLLDISIFTRLYLPIRLPAIPTDASLDFNGKPLIATATEGGDLVIPMEGIVPPVEVTVAFRGRRATLVADYLEPGYVSVPLPSIIEEGDTLIVESIETPEGIDADIFSIQVEPPVGPWGAPTGN